MITSLVAHMMSLLPLKLTQAERLSALRITKNELQLLLFKESEIKKKKKGYSLYKILITT